MARKMNPADKKLLDALADEARALAPKYEGNAHIWKALDNLGLGNDPDRTKWYARVRNALKKGKSELKKERERELQMIKEAKDQIMLEDSYAAEARHKGVFAAEERNEEIAEERRRMQEPGQPEQKQRRAAK